MRLNGDQLGFLPANVSRGDDPSGLASQMDRGDQFQCRISDLTGGDGLTLGVNIEITAGEGLDDIEASPTQSRYVEKSDPDTPWFLIFAVFVVVLAIVIFILNR